MIATDEVKESFISVLVPTTGRSTLSAVLGQLAYFRVGEVIIYDSGEVPSYSRDDVMIVCEALFKSGIEVHYIRADAEGIGYARADLIEYAHFDTCLFLDDDVLLPSSDLEQMYQTFIDPQYNNSEGFVAPCCVIAADFLGVKGLKREPIRLEELNPATTPDHVLPYYRYKGAPWIQLSYCGTQALLFSKKSAEPAKEVLFRWKKGEPREDTYLTSKMGKGWLVTSAVCWHLETDRQTREWKNKDEERGYELVLSGNLENFLEKDV